MDAVEKRAAGQTLSVRDEQRLRNHQLRMMRRQWLNDLVSIYGNKRYFINCFRLYHHVNLFIQTIMYTKWEQEEQLCFVELISCGTPLVPRLSSQQIVTGIFNQLLWTNSITESMYSSSKSTFGKTRPTLREISNIKKAKIYKTQF